MYSKKIVAVVLAVAALLTVVYFCGLALAMRSFFPVDDAYISFRYVDNWARGLGPVFNPGERVEGYSNFLYVVMLTIAAEAGITPPLASRIVNAASVLFLLVWFLRRPASQSSLVISCWAALVMVINYHTIVNTLAGLEAPLAAALCLGGVASMSSGKRRIAAACFLLLALLRPEGLVLMAVAAALDLGPAVLARDWGSVRRLGSSWLWVAGVPFAAFLGWRLLYYGYPLPNSIYAKDGYTLATTVGKSLPYVARGFEAYWPLLILALGVFFLKPGSEAKPLVRNAAVLLVTLVAICCLIGKGDPYKKFLRYLYTGLPLLVLLAQIGAQAAIRFAAERKRSLPSLAAFAVTLGLMTFQAAFAYPKEVTQWFERAREQAGGVGAKLRSGFAELVSQDRAPHVDPFPNSGLVHHDLAAWLLEHADRERDSLLISEVGIAPYYSGLKTLDSFGLVDGHIAHQPGNPGSKGVAPEIFDRRPTYMAFKKNTRLGGGTGTDVRVFHHPRMWREYDFVNSFGYGSRRVLLFRRVQPDISVRYDFFQAFHNRRLFVQDEDGWSRSKNLASRIRKQERFVLLEPKAKQALKEQLLDRVFSRRIQPFELAEPMRAFLARRPDVLRQRLSVDGRATAIRYKVEVPPGGQLHFSVLLLPSKPPASDLGAIVGAVEVTDATGERHQVFSEVFGSTSTPSPEKPQSFTVDLERFATSKITLDFVASPASEDRTDSYSLGWVQPHLVETNTD